MAMPDSLKDTKIEFIDIELSLVHIPIELYTQCIHPILQLLMPTDGIWTAQQFLNITINQVEASIILPKALASTLFGQLASRSNAKSSSTPSVVIAPDDYLLIWVDGATYSPSQRLIDLTTPLALARIPIFFITTYASDYIVCPRRSRTAVVDALNAQGFECNPETSWSHIDSVPSQNFAQRPHASSSGSSSQLFAASSTNGPAPTSTTATTAPGTPPPTNLPELQLRTLSLLAKAQIRPIVNANIRLVQCGGRSEPQYSNQLLLNVIRLLLAHPRFFSLTLASDEQPSFLLETQYLHLFALPDGNLSLLNGTGTDVLIPLVLDLRKLSLESIGIVCGLAGRLVDVTRGQTEGAIHMGYLSTTQAGAVMVMEDDLERTMLVFEPDDDDDDNEEGVNGRLDRVSIS